MPSTADRLQNLIAENLEVDGKPVSTPVDMNSSLTAIGVASMDVVAFARLIQQEFSVQLAPEQCTELATLTQLAEFIDANS
ncbi:MAG: acyl carrier protein [Chloroflexi bacterium]|nr:acyl carrier protein [Chloroflexota bacterium]MYD47271.1 acyl carrier protein [Chloroflexota bacterium]